MQQFRYIIIELWALPLLEIFVRRAIYTVDSPLCGNQLREILHMYISFSILVYYILL